MLAVLALVGVAAAAHATMGEKGEEQLRREYDATVHNSDDPQLFHYGQDNPTWLRLRGTENVREPIQPFLHGWVEHDIKAQQLERMDGVLRGPESLEQDDIDALRAFRLETEFTDLPFTGYNNSTDNYRLRAMHSLPPQMTEGLSVLYRYPATMDDTVGVLPQVNSLMGPLHEDRYLYEHGFNECRTGRRMFSGVDQPVFAHFPRIVNGQVV